MLFMLGVLAWITPHWRDSRLLNLRDAQCCRLFHKAEEKKWVCPPTGTWLAFRRGLAEKLARHEGSVPQHCYTSVDKHPAFKESTERMASHNKPVHARAFPKAAVQYIHSGIASSRLYFPVNFLWSLIMARISRLKDFRHDDARPMPCTRLWFVSMELP
jgi:hypothetical protein